MTLFGIVAFGQSASVKGRVLGKETNAPLEKATVYSSLRAQKGFTGGDGVFQIDLPLGKQTLFIEKEGYKKFSLEITNIGGLDLGTLFLESLRTETVHNDAVVVELSETELTEDSQSQDISGLLQSSNDVFVSTAGYVFGPARFRMRGYDSENTKVSINGVNLNDVESGRAYWSVWGGLNDATREKEVVNSLNKSDFTFGAIGGATNIETRASQFRKGVKASYSYANRSYNNRAMVTYATGLMENGWAFAASGSRRWAEEGYQEGTFYDAWAYFLSAEKRLGNKHVLNLTAFGAPNRRGKAGATTKEMYELAGTNYYNPYWGFQNGEKRNSRVANHHKPVIILNHDYKISPKLDLKSSVLYTFGKGGNSALNWGKTKDPREDYYRRLPSIYGDDKLAFEQMLEAYDIEKYRQIDFDYMYFINQSGRIENIDHKNLGNRSGYIIEERRDDISRFAFNTIATYDVNEDLKVKVGGNYEMYIGKHFKVVEDLLGGDFYLDIDKFAERDISQLDGPDAIQSDLNNPNRTVKEGDTFGYDYETHVNTGKGWVQAEYSINNTDVFVAAEVSNTQFWRTGNMKNGKFPTNSYGDSEKTSFTNFGGKIGVLHKISGRHYISANAMYLTRAPKIRYAFTSPRTRNEIVPNLKEEKIMSGELSYSYRSPIISGRLTGYYTKFMDQMNILNFYNDAESTFGSYIMRDIDKQHMGIEFAVEAKVIPELKVKAVAAVGEYIYTNRPKATLYQDNNADAIFDDRTIFYKNYRVSGTPQQAFSVGVKYDSPKYWWVGVDANLFREVYLSMHPERRTNKAIDGLDGEKDKDKIKSIIEQEKLDDAFTLNLFAGKSWKVKDYYISLSANVTNILNNQDFITGGYEQLRFDYGNKDVSRFGNKYYYMPGTQFFLNLSVRF